MTNALTERIEHAWPRRLLRSVQFGLARLTSRDGFVVARSAPYGLTFKGPAADVITRHIYRLGAHEPVITRYLLRNVRLEAGDIALDVGANLGWYSVLLNRLSAPGRADLRLRAGPAYLQAAADQPCRQRGHARERPSTSRSGRRQVPPRCAATRTATTGATASSRGMTSQDRSPCPWKRWMRSRPHRASRGKRIAFMKVDVEGFEYFVLRGATQLLRPATTSCCEYSPQSLALAGESAGCPDRAAEGFRHVSAGLHRRRTCGRSALRNWPRCRRSWTCC